MLGIYYIYTFSKFNSYFIKLVTLKLYNYSFLKKIIKKMEKYFIKCLNIIILNIISTSIKIFFIYAPYIIKIN